MEKLKSPTLFRIIQLELPDIVESNYKLELSEAELARWIVRQGDCSLFAQIRRITGQEWERDHLITEMVFCDLKRLMRKKEIATEVVRGGFVLNGRQYYCSERSASMRRNGFASFVDSEIYFQLQSAIDMGMPVENMEVVYSKWVSYRGLFLSGAHLIE